MPLVSYFGDLLFLYVTSRICNSHYRLSNSYFLNFDTITKSQERSMCKERVKIGGKEYVQGTGKHVGGMRG